jgi:hypothetical protein
MRKDRFTDEALRAAYALAELKYSEDPEDQQAFAEAYDFARCQRPDGSFYGTSGQCRKGKDAGAKPEEPKKAASAAHTKKERERLSPELEAYRKERDAMTAKIRSDAQKEGEQKRAAAGGKKLKTDFRKDVEKGAAKRKVADEKRAARMTRDNELRGQIREGMAALKPVKAELARRERAMKEAERRVKKDPSKENRANLKTMQRAVREQDLAARKAEREIEKMAKERLRISQQNERERMTPAQRREAARVRKIIKERG